MKRWGQIPWLIAAALIGPGVIRELSAQNLTPVPVLKPVPLLKTSNRPEQETGKPSLPPEPPNVTVTDMQAFRSSGGLAFSTRLNVQLKISGGGFQESSQAAWRITKAVDDLGEDLLRPQEEVPYLGGFFPVITLRLPSRKAQVIKELSGVAEVLLTSRDPAATFAVTGFAGKSRVEVAHPSLVAVGAKLTILSKAEYDRSKRVVGQNRQPAYQPRPGSPPIVVGVTDRFDGNSVMVLQRDPNRRIVRLEFLSRSGQPIQEDFGETTFPQKGQGDSVVCSAYRFGQRLPDSTVMRIVVATPKALVSVPFSLKNVALP